MMKKLFNHKVFSGALQFTVFIGVIIALLLSGLIMLAYSHNFFTLQSKNAIENIQLSNTGMHFLLQNTSISNDTLLIEGFDEGNQKIEVQSSNWGIYDRAIVKTTNRKKIFYKTAFLGATTKTQDRTALYLKENYKPLVVVGNTIIKGAVFLPIQGVKPGNIAGNSFNGQELVQGLIKTSNSSLPKIGEDRRKNIEQLLNNKLEIDENKYLGESQINFFRNSFIKPTLIYFSKEQIILDNSILKGNIIIKSEKAIKIKKTTILNDVIVVAPVVEIEDNVEGNFQVIANKTIKVGKNCKLNYPSALVLVQEKDKLLNNTIDEYDNQITIGENTEMKGSVFYFESNNANNFKTQIVLSENAKLTGEIYCEGNLELSGSVIGSVFTNQFVVNKNGSVFLNHVYNGLINSYDLNENFCGILMEQNHKGVAKWTY